MRRWLALALLVGLPIGMAGQVMGGVAGTVSLGNSRAPVRPVKPYTMKQTTTITREYGDGLSSTVTSEVASMRDSEQKTRNEREQMEAAPTKYIRDGRVSHTNGVYKLRMITVSDPAARMFMNWTEGGAGQQQVIVTRFPEPEIVNRPVAAGLRNAPAAPKVAPAAPQGGDEERVAEVHTEKLGEKAIQGVIAEGTRVTTKYSAGVYGMNREFTVVREDWLARDYHLVVESMVDDPRMGKQVTTLVSFTEGDPDPAMFKPPAGYKMVGNVKEEELVEKQ
jgi:hypothetical protein